MTRLDWLSAENFLIELPTLAEIYALGCHVLASVCDPYQQELGHLCITVDNFPCAQILYHMKITDPYDLLALYTPFSAFQSREGVICLYRGPLVQYARQQGHSLEWILRQVMSHEIGRYLELSDTEMDILSQMIEQKSGGRNRD